MSTNNYCGLFRTVNHVRKYIPQVKMAVHASILSSVARTTMIQTFENTDSENTWDEVKYMFPLLDGVSVVGFTCTIGDRVIKGVVKEKQQAREVYEEAKSLGQKAALLEQTFEASDVFVTSVGNVPPKTTVRVEVTYLGELAHDAEVDGIRGTIPSVIAPRYGALPEAMRSTTAQLGTTGQGGLEIVIDAQMPAGSVIKSIQSPSHPISVSIGTLSTSPDAEPSLQNASARLSLPAAELEKDFVIQVVATNTSNPVAMLEKHPTLPNERALMATLVPKFALPPERPEIVFVCDRSGSMQSKIANLKNALHIFLKSLPVGVKFNICSFGSHHSFLWDKSRTYDKASLDEATRYVGTFYANMGGTEMYPAIEDTFKRRYKDINLEVLLLTDGDIWRPDDLFQLIRQNREESKNAIRLFTLAIGSGSSSALTEGAARAGNGFSQAVGDHEKMNSKVVRMLKAALTPHIHDYTLEVKYEAGQSSDDDFEIIEKAEDCLVIDDNTQEKSAQPQEPISLFDPSVDVDTVMGNTGDVQNKYDHLPSVTVPKLLQAPFEIPTLYPFNRTSVYMLMSEETAQRPVKSVILRASSQHGPLELEIPVTTLSEPGETFHQLAARKATKELEEGAGWIFHARDSDGKLLKNKHAGRLSDMVEREAVRLGVKYNVGGKWCSFVAVEDGESRGDSFKKERVVNMEIGNLDNMIMVSDSIADNSSRVMRTGARHRAAPSPFMAVAARCVPAPMMNQQAPGGASLFGAPPPPPPPAPSAPPAPPAPQAPGGLFGASGGNQSSTGTTLFGAPPQPAPQASGGGLFGASGGNQSSTGTTLFGAAAAPPPAPARSGGLFRTPPPAPVRAGGGGLFGFAAQPQTQGASLFGGGLFGRTAAQNEGAEDNKRLPRDPLEALVSLQSFGGCWESSEAVFRVIGITREQAEEKLRAKGEAWSEGLVQGGADALATASVLAFLKAKLGKQEEEWEMIGDKAWGWLESVVPALEEKRGDLEAYLGDLFG